MTTTITVTGTSCAGCEEAVETALETLENVSSASADREHETATVEGEATPTTLVASVEDAGYDVRL